jgi:uncharacterized membrane protein YkoI
MFKTTAHITLAVAIFGAVTLSAPLIALGQSNLTEVPAATVPIATARSQQEEAREALRQGLVRPLEDVLAEARKLIRGDIVEIEFEREDERFIYEIEYVAEDGHLMEIKIDAKTLAVISHGEEQEGED